MTKTELREKLIELQMQAKIGWTKEEFADYLIANCVTVQEWIPVSDPPKEDGIYCVIVENHKSRKCKKRTHARYKNGRWLDLYDNWENRCWDVALWTPMPEPPKTKGGD